MLNYGKPRFAHASVPVVGDAVDIASDVADAVSDGVSDGVASVQQASEHTIDTLAEALRIIGESNRSHGEVLGTIASTQNQIVSTLQGLANVGVSTTATVADAIADVPAESTDTIETVIEGDAQPPHTRKQRKLGRGRKK